MKYKILIFIIVSIILTLAINIYYIYPKQFIKLDINTQLKQKTTPTYLNNLIKKALDNNDIQTAMMYQNLANYLNIEINQSLKNEIKKQNNFLNKAKRDSKDFFNGFFKGKSNNNIQLIGKISSDFTFIGDIRDIYNEGKKMYYNQSYDKITLGLSAIGMVLSATTISSLGATAPIKTGLSILKVAKTSGKISKKLLKVINIKILKSIDFKKLKTINFSSFNNVKKAKNIIKNSVNLKPIKKILEKIQNISKNTSKIDTLKLLKYTDNEKDLEKLVKLSNKYKHNTLAVLKILGKSALKGSKIIVKYSISFIIEVVSLIISIFSLLGLIFLKKFN